MAVIKLIIVLKVKANKIKTLFYNLKLRIYEKVCYVSFGSYFYNEFCC